MLHAPQLAFPLADANKQSQARGAEILAQAYLDYMSGCWRGDDATKFGERIIPFVGTDLPPEPWRPADAYSPHGAGGRGIRWYERGDEVLGYTHGCATGYRIPITCIPELVSAGGIDVVSTSVNAGDGIQPCRKNDAAILGIPRLPARTRMIFKSPAAIGAVA